MRLQVLTSKIFVFSLLAFILIIHAFATWRQFYFHYRIIDVPMHLLGGACVLVFLYWYLKKINLLGSFPWASFLGYILSLGIVLFVGVFWEFYEFFYDFLFNYKLATILQFGSLDTLKDLANGMLGATAIYFIIYKDLKKIT